MSRLDQQGLDGLAAEVGALLLNNGQRLATAESCTGGWVAQCVTAVAGSSAWFERGFVTYSNDAKREMLGVESDTLRLHGAVSEASAVAMAQGALRNSNADWSLAVTGIAGPDGGLPDKPVGTVWFAWAGAQGELETQVRHFDGDRRDVRASAVAHALRGILRNAAVVRA